MTATKFTVLPQDGALQDEDPVTRKVVVLRWVWRIVAAVFIVGAAVAAIWALTHRSVLAKVFEFVKELGFWGNLIMLALYVIVSLPIAVGYTVLTLASGFMYGWLFGTITTFVGIAIGASISFFVCGTVAREWVEKKISNTSKLAAFLDAVRRNGFKLMFLMRLTPVPFGLQNALFSVSGLHFGWYLLAACAGMLPEAILWCYFGSTARRLAEIMSGHASFGVLEKVSFGVELAIAVIVFIILGVLARRAMRKAMIREEEVSEEGSSLLQNMGPSDETKQPNV